MFHSISLHDRPDAEDICMSQSPWASACVGKRLDSELSMQLRILLKPEFEQADSWSALRRALRSKGFSLKVEQGRLRVVDCISRVDICSTGFLGFPTSQLESMFGSSAINGLKTIQPLG